MNTWFHCSPARTTLSGNLEATVDDDEDERLIGSGEGVERSGENAFI
jgi:hypothetical protein